MPPLPVLPGPPEPDPEKKPVQITAKMVNELRSRTGAPLMECKKALVEAAGDVDAAEDLLRKQGVKTAQKKAGAETGEGRVRMRVSGDGRRGALLALTCQTDFSANTDEFGGLADALAALALDSEAASAEQLLGLEIAGKGSVTDAVTALAGKIGENVRVARVARANAPEGRVGGYLHHDQRAGAMIAVTTAAPAEATDAFLRKLGMHIVSMRPLSLRPEDVPAEVVERERAVYAESEEVLAKPEDKRAMIVEGKLKKFLAGVALLGQPWVLDPSLSVQKALEASLGAGSRVDAFERFAVGS